MEAEGRRRPEPVGVCFALGFACCLDAGYTGGVCCWFADRRYYLPDARLVDWVPLVSGTKLCLFEAHASVCGETISH